jgi:hypothetical protein
MRHFDHAGHLAEWRRIRRYAVPRWMIEEATESRLAGDWEGACRAARVKVEVDLRSLSRLHGSRVRNAVQEDLRHLAPDLLRWHLPRPRVRSTMLAPNRAIVLVRYGRRLLHVVTPSILEGPQHLTLRLGPVETGPGLAFTVEDWTRFRHLWDVRHHGELLERYGGGRGRAPFFHPDGTPLAEEELGDPGTGPAGLTERVTLLQDAGEPMAALEAAGIHIRPLDERSPSQWDEPWDGPWHAGTAPETLATLAPTRILPELEQVGGHHWRIDPHSGLVVVLNRRGPRPGVHMGRRYGDIRDLPLLPEPAWRRLPDLDLLRTGRITPEELHPLVRSALFPARPAAEGPVGPPDPEPAGTVRVRCRGEWHIVQVQSNGTLRITHSTQERERESAMRALGGQVRGCFAVLHTWETGTGRLPRRLRAQRQELFMRALHGDAPGVLRMLDQDASPFVRDGRGRTLLHYVHMLDHIELLPRLLDAGLDLEARDRLGRTPLLSAVAEYGMEEVIRALVTAGARTDAVDFKGWSVYNLIDRTQRTDLAWLEQHPEEKRRGVRAEPPGTLR